MEKIWYILLSGKQEGPYSLMELRSNAKITPDTLVWKEGFAEWIPMRNVPELAQVFQDETKTPDEKDLKPPLVIGADEQLAIDMQPSLPNLFFG